MSTAPPLRIVAGVILHADGQRALAARRADGPEPRAGLWEFPGGKVEAGESDAAALARELDEELGVAVIVGELLDARTVSYADLTIRLATYRCRLAPDAPPPTAREHAELCWAAADELFRLQWSGGDREVARRVSELLALNTTRS